jgi:50S ribosomal protein L16 3-hydroxylase
LSDPELKVQPNPGTINPEVIDQLDRKMRAKLQDRRQLALWFGQYSTAPKSLETVIPPEETQTPKFVEQLLCANNQIRWNEGSRFAYYEFEDEIALFVDGEQYLLRGDATPIAPLLCAGTRPDMTELAGLTSDDAICGLLCTLINQGSLYFE